MGKVSNITLYSKEIKDEFLQVVNRYKALLFLTTDKKITTDEILKKYVIDVLKQEIKEYTDGNND